MHPDISIRPSIGPLFYHTVNIYKSPCFLANQVRNNSIHSRHLQSVYQHEDVSLALRALFFYSGSGPPRVKGPQSPKLLYPQAPSSPGLGSLAPHPPQKAPALQMDGNSFLCSLGHCLLSVRCPALI